MWRYFCFFTDFGTSGFGLRVEVSVATTSPRMESALRFCLRRQPRVLAKGISTARRTGPKLPRCPVNNIPWLHYLVCSNKRACSEIWHKELERAKQHDTQRHDEDPEVLIPVAQTEQWVVLLHVRELGTKCIIIITTTERSQKQANSRSCRRRP